MSPTNGDDATITCEPAIWQRAWHRWQHEPLLLTDEDCELLERFGVGADQVIARQKDARLAAVATRQRPADARAPRVAGLSPDLLAVLMAEVVRPINTRLSKLEARCEALERLRGQRPQ